MASTAVHRGQARPSEGIAARAGGVRVRPAATLALAMCALLLAACGERPGPDSLLPSPYTAQGTREQVVLVASTRARDQRPGTFFNGERAPLSFAKVELSIPPTHKPGEIEWPKTPPGNPETEMVVREAVYRDTSQQFLADLNAELAKRPKGDRDVFVFVHGYNTQFAEAVYRMSQMATDAKANGVPVVFTWASRATTEAYVYDNNSATAARDSLEETLRLVFASQAEEVNIMAHSMGNWLTVEALRQVRISERRLPVNRVGNIILAAPDIDVDVFKSQLRRFGKLPKPFIVILSRDDKALGFSDFIAGGKLRLGAYTDDTELVELGAVVIDMTDVKALDRFNHGKFAQLASMSPEIEALIAQRVAQGNVPSNVEINGIHIRGLDRFAPKPAPDATAAHGGNGGHGGHAPAAAGSGPPGSGAPGSGAPGVGTPSAAARGAAPQSAAAHAAPAQAQPQAAPTVTAAADPPAPAPIR